MNAPSETRSPNHSENSLLECVCAISNYHGLKLSPSLIKQRLELEPNASLSEKDLLRHAEKLGIEAHRTTCKTSDLKKRAKSLPLICSDTKNKRFAMLVGMRPSSANPGTLEYLLVHPNKGPKPVTTTEEVMKSQWGGCQLCIGPPDYATEEVDQGAFGFLWIIRRLLKHSKVWRTVALSSAAIIILGFALSFFTMLVLDKVIGHHALATLHVLFIVAIVAATIQACMTYIRTLLVTHCSSILDVEITEHTLRKALALPISFFHNHPVGRITKVLGEGFSINRFLTGQLLFTLFEAAALFIALPVLFIFSWKLSLIVLGTALLMIINLMIFMPFYRHFLDRLFKLETKRQGAYVETFSGIFSIKGANAEERKLQQILDLSTELAIEQRKSARYSGASGEISSWLQRLMNLTIIWFGAQLVLDSAMSVGVLIGFNILAGRVSGPLLQLAKLLSDYQRVNVGMQSLSMLTSHPPERLRKGGATSPILGNINVQSLSFGYTPERLVLKQLQFSIQAGEKVGIVGKSGCGKSTLAQLLLGFYTPNEGRVKIDGIDLQSYDLSYLRSSVGMVEQSPRLFEGTVLENISLSYPHASLDDVIKVAKAAGAHDFIEDLKDGYDTVLEEGGSNLSGGQQQRICIARSLMGQPKVLLFDEATSALDPESEQVIMQQLDSICAGATLVNISHRLSQMVKMDRVLVLEAGEIVGFGSHQQLLLDCTCYQHLWKEQQITTA